MTEEKKEISKWFLFFLSLLMVFTIVMSIAGYFGKITGTAVEREVFEQSYQKQAGDKQRLNTYKAQLAEINSRLLSAKSVEKQELEAQASMLRVQISSFK